MNYSEKLIEKADRIRQQCLDEMAPLPSPDEFGQVQIPYQDLREICNQRMRFGWCNGVYEAFSAVGSDAQKSLTTPLK